MMAPGSETRTRHANTARRRAQILLAGRDVFLEWGLENARVEDICTRAKASIGSFYHHFGAREILAGEIYLEALQRYLSPLAEKLTDEPTAQEFFRLMVFHYIGWVQNNPEWARYLIYIRCDLQAGELDSRIAALNDKYLKKAFDLLKLYCERHEIRKLPRYLYAPLIIGPCEMLARQYLTSSGKSISCDVIEQVADVIWQGLKC